MALIPSRGAMSAGFWFSTSRCHRTSCQRSGSEAKALAAAPPSNPAIAVSVNGTPGSYGVMSPVVVSFWLLRILSTCSRRTAVSR